MFPLFAFSSLLFCLAGLLGLLVSLLLLRCQFLLLSHLLLFGFCFLLGFFLGFALEFLLRFGCQFLLVLLLFLMLLLLAIHVDTLVQMCLEIKHELACILQPCLCLLCLCVGARTSFCGSGQQFLDFLQILLIHCLLGCDLGVVFCFLFSLSFLLLLLTQSFVSSPTVSNSGVALNIPVGPDHDGHFQLARDVDVFVSHLAICANPSAVGDFTTCILQ